MFFLKSLVFPIFLPSFYREAVKRGSGKAFGTYFLFTLIITIAATVYFGLTFGKTLIDLPKEFDEFPSITIEDGTLTMDPYRAYEFSDNGSYFAIDPTGSITEIPGTYSSGMLMTKDSVVFRSEENEEDIQMTYTQVLSEFDRDSFSIDSETIARVLQSVGVVVLILSPFFIFLGYFIGRLFTILFISIIGLIVLSIAGHKNAFEKSFIITCYAAIPIFYLNTFFWLIGKLTSHFGLDLSLGSLCCLLPLIISVIKWSMFWGIGAYGIRKFDDTTS